eukprot:5864456-Amphidinium_carterae.1
MMGRLSVDIEPNSCDLYIEPLQGLSLASTQISMPRVTDTSCGKQSACLQLPTTPAPVPPRTIENSSSKSEVNHQTSIIMLKDAIRADSSWKTTIMKRMHGRMAHKSMP